MRSQKEKKLEKGKEARRAARASGLVPPRTRVVADKRKKALRHKPNLWTEAE